MVACYLEAVGPHFTISILCQFKQWPQCTCLQCSVLAFCCNCNSETVAFTQTTLENTTLKWSRTIRSVIQSIHHSTNQTEESKLSCFYQLRYDMITKHFFNATKFKEAAKILISSVYFLIFILIH